MEQETTCPGCGLTMPSRPGATQETYSNTSAECWSVYCEVLAAEYSDAMLFGEVHQLTVDTNAVPLPAILVWRAWAAHHAAVAEFLQLHER